MTKKITKIYKLIAHPAENKQPRLPFYGYTIEDPDGNELGQFTKVVFTLDPEKSAFATMTLYRKYIDTGGEIKEEVLENVDAEIEVRETKEQ